jgi:DNA mismatch repair protein MutL
MSKIRILSDALASQVAAGEVVERPAAVVRELVENSLDAGAKHVEVHVQRGGSALIRVIDDGSGMNREDALLCIERHATSKIRTKEDLSAIGTFGFRGEALPSIASVSRFKMSTREADALTGTEVEINGGKVHHVSECGGPSGTSIEVRSLFFNVPARRKFLRTDPTEYAHVEQQFRLHAIAHPEVAFTLTRDGQTVFHLPQTSDRIERIRGLIGELAERLVELEPHEHRGVTVSGFIGGPGVSRSTRQMQLTFLNGRPIESPSINYGLREGYHTVLMKRQHPVTFLMIDMDPHAYDINVHPAKKEARFHDGIGVREAVARTVSRALAGFTGLPTGHPTGRPAGDLRPPGAIESRQSEMPLPGANVDVPLRLDSATQPATPSEATPEPNPAPPTSPTIETTPDTPASARPRLRILGVLRQLYVIMEGEDGLVLMDQHAAHERVMFEKMRQAMEKDGVPSQRLLMPLTLQTTPNDADLLRWNLDALAQLGIEAEPFGPNTFKIEALPTFLKTDEPAAWMDQVIEELRQLGTQSSSLRLGEDMIATTVCRHAVKANDLLSIPELEALLRDLFECEMPFCCPHGRPTLIQISDAELERKFGRRAP